MNWSLTDKNMRHGLGQIAQKSEGRNRSLPFDKPHITKHSSKELQ